MSLKFCFNKFLTIVINLYYYIALGNQEYRHFQINQLSKCDYPSLEN